MSAPAGYDVERILDDHGIAHAGMSTETRAGLAKLIAARNARRAKVQQQVLDDLVHPIAPVAKPRGLRWRLALVHADGRRIELGEARFPTYIAAQKHVVAFMRGKTSLSTFVPVIEGPLS